MADETDTPPPSDQPAPRRAPRKAAADGAKTPARRGRPPKAKTDTPIVDKIEATARRAVKAPAAKVSEAAETVVKATKAVKPRSTKRATPRPAAKSRTASAKKGSAVRRATGKVGGRWGVAAIAGGVAAAGAAALLALRSSTPKGSSPTRPVQPDTAHAHQTDGSDATKSFEAGIADEGTVPE